MLGGTIQSSRNVISNSVIKNTVWCTVTVRKLFNQWHSFKRLHDDNAYGFTTTFTEIWQLQYLYYLYRLFSQKSKNHSMPISVWSWLCLQKSICVMAPALIGNWQDTLRAGCDSWLTGWLGDQSCSKGDCSNVTRGWWQEEHCSALFSFSEKRSILSIICVNPWSRIYLVI